MRCRSDGTLTADQQYSARELAPQHVAPKRKPDLLFEEVRKPAGREEDHGSRVLNRQSEVVGLPNRGEHPSDPLVQSPTRRRTGAQRLDAELDQRADLKALKRLIEKPAQL